MHLFKPYSKDLLNLVVLYQTKKEPIQIDNGQKILNPADRATISGFR